MVGVSVGPAEIFVVLGIIILLFGAKKLPELARSVGRSTSEFKKGVEEGASDADVAGTSDDADDRAQRKAETSE